MIQKIKDFFSDIVWELKGLTKTAKVAVFIVNAIGLVIFFYEFPGIILHVLGLVLAESLFLVAVYFLKIKLLDKF